MKAPWARRQTEGSAPLDERESMPRTAVAVALLAVALLAVGTFALGLLVSGPTLDVLTRPGSDEGALFPNTTTSSPSPSAATSSPSTPTARTSAPADYVPGGVVGPGLTTPGVLVRVEPDANGDLMVVERLRLTAAAPRLTVALPMSTGVAAAAMSSESQVVDLRVTADGDAVTAGVSGFRSPTTITLPGSARTIEMRYRLVGAAVRSTPAPEGRALAILPPITTADFIRALPIIVEAKGAAVTNVVCPGLTLADHLCGRDTGEIWNTVPLVAGTTAVVAQLKLPTPAG